MKIFFKEITVLILCMLLLLNHGIIFEMRSSAKVGEFEDTPTTLELELNDENVSVISNSFDTVGSAAGRFYSTFDDARIYTDDSYLYQGPF